MIRNGISADLIGKTISDLISIQSKKYNEKTFLISEPDAKEITYNEVDAFTKQVASYLRT